MAVTIRSALVGAACLLAVAMLVAVTIAEPTRLLRSDLGRWIKPEALTEEGRTALLK